MKATYPIPPLRITDVKQYLYCPRIIYFTYVVPVNPKVTRKMEYGKEEHELLEKKEKRRTLKRYNLPEGRREFRIPLYSPRLELSGILDMAIITSQDIHPVEYKNTNRKPGRNHIYQLTAYALLMEEKYFQPLRRGYIYLRGVEEVVPIVFTEERKLYVKRVLGAIRNMVSRESMGKILRSRGRCIDCEYRYFCGDRG